MPTYEYSCRACNEVFEVFQSMRDDPLTHCPKCGQAGVKRLIGRGAGIIFKGGGFYETDYKRPANQPAGGEGAGDTAKPKSTETASSPGPAKPGGPAPAASGPSS